MSRRITCTYQLSEELLGEYVKQLKHSSRAMYGGLSVALIVCGAAGMTGTIGGIVMPPVLLLLGILLLATMFLYSDAVMKRRMAARYRSRFGGVNVPVRVMLDSSITYVLNGQELRYRYDGIDRVTETEHLLVINYPTNAVLLKKDGLPDGTSVNDVKELIFRHISIANQLKEERRAAERRAMRRRHEKKGRHRRGADTAGEAKERAELDEGGSGR